MKIIIYHQLSKKSKSSIVIASCRTLLHRFFGNVHVWNNFYIDGGLLNLAKQIQKSILIPKCCAALYELLKRWVSCNKITDRAIDEDFGFFNIIPLPSLGSIGLEVSSYEPEMSVYHFFVAQPR